MEKNEVLEYLKIMEYRLIDILSTPTVIGITTILSTPTVITFLGM